MFAAKQGHHAVLNTLMENDNLDINAQENVSKRNIFLNNSMYFFTIYQGCQVQCTIFCHSVQKSGYSSRANE